MLRGTLISLKKVTRTSAATRRNHLKLPLCSSLCGGTFNFLFVLFCLTPAGAKSTSDKFLSALFAPPADAPRGRMGWRLRVRSDAKGGWRRRTHGAPRPLQSEQCERQKCNLHSSGGERGVFIFWYAHHYRQEQKFYTSLNKLNYANARSEQIKYLPRAIKLQGF